MKRHKGRNEKGGRAVRNSDAGLKVSVLRIKLTNRKIMRWD